jgi:hypothetical protein
VAAVGPVVVVVVERELVALAGRACGSLARVVEAVGLDRVAEELQAEPAEAVGAVSLAGKVPHLGNG